MGCPEISILVPVYNVEVYLKRFICSVLLQNFIDWEMILVDDGSLDKCPQICDDAVKIDNRIKVVHKENGGLISARMAGVEVARGKYYVFWDSDDTVPFNALSILYNHIEKGYDVVKASALRRTNDGGECPLESYSFVGEVIGNTEYLKIQMNDEIAPYLWNGIYKASLFDDSVYDESIKYDISVGEDWVTNLIVGLKVNKALITEDVVYHYYYNPTSYMSSYVRSKSYLLREFEVLYIKGVLEDSVIRDCAENKYFNEMVRSFFIPELGFSSDLYEDVMSYLNKVGCINDAYYKVDPKFLRFIKCKTLYYLYSMVYCFLFRYVKLKGRKRRVL